MKRLLIPLATAAFWLASAAGLSAQYFGQNKVQYDTFDFEILETEHFRIYYYPDEAEATRLVARMAERWYRRLSDVLDHQLRGPQHLILYASHPDFRQTNAIPGAIGEGTGGVTEVLKRRIVLPLAASLAETDHVLGHELVHAFQFDITTEEAGPGAFELPGALRLPLWFMEGMAEYLSLGPHDAHTAMWIRDALIHDSLPSLSDLDDPDFFPYRYGQALWAYIGGRYGDRVIGQILMAAGISGNPQSAFRDVLGLSAEELSEAWHAAVRADYAAAIAGSDPTQFVGRRIFTGGGDINVSPSLSPDGTRVVFFSERDLFSIDMFLADVQTGRILSKITNTATDPHIESLQFINSTGSWNPDGRRFAYGAIVGGQPRLVVVEPSTRKQVGEYFLPGIGEIFNTTWAPDGERIAFAAVAGGLSNLFVLDTRDGSLSPLTDDPWAALHPVWSPDGNTLAFVSDRFTSDIDSLSFGDYRIALLDLPTLAVSPAPGSPIGGKEINPQWSSDGERIYYLGDASGITNLYRLEMATGERLALTDAATGLSGITSLSPALSIGAGDEAVASVFDDGDYRLFELETDAGDRLLAGSGDNARLPPVEGIPSDVLGYLDRPGEGLPPVTDYATHAYRAGLSLDYVAPPTVGVGTSSFGTFVGGGTGLYWSDILGNRRLMTAFELNSSDGDILRDLTAVVAYQDRRHRWNWGGAFGQVPFRSGFFSVSTGSLNGDPTVREEETRFWQIQRDIIGTAVHPFNRAFRLELSGGYRQISFKSDSIVRVYNLQTGGLVSVEEPVFSDPESLNLGISAAALVYDTSVSAGLGPILGQRYRLEGSTSVGSLSYTTVLADYRRYLMPVRPVTFAFRVLHYGRYGGGAEDRRLQQLFLGDQMLVRGYDVNSFSAGECSPGSGSGSSCPVFDRLVGSRVGVANFEIRAPLFGPLGLVSQSFLPLEIAAFFDAGTAWTRSETPDWAGGDRSSVTSHGASMRINLLGVALGQIDLVHPNNRPQRDWLWQFGLTQSF